MFLWLIFLSFRIGCCFHLFVCCRLTTIRIFEFVGTLLPTNWCKNAILLRFFPLHTSIYSFNFALFCCGIVILGAISANLSFWQIGNRYPCSTCIESIMCVCVIVYVHCRHFMSFIWSSLGCRKTIRHKKKYNL